MIHYVCLGACGGTSDKPGACNTEECPRRGLPLAECDCPDGLHKSAIPPEEEKGDFTDIPQK